MAASRWNPGIHRPRMVTSWGMPHPERVVLRLQTHDYRSGWFFVTIVTARRRPILGQIVAGSFRPSPLGECVRNELLQISSRWPSCVVDVFALMPDHLHAIIALHSQRLARRPKGSAGSAGGLGTMISHFKRGCALALKARHLAGSGQLWQRGYYERIIRTERDLMSIRRYVNNNVRAAVVASRPRPNTHRP